MDVKDFIDNTGRMIEEDMSMKQKADFVDWLWKRDKSIAIQLSQYLHESDTTLKPIVLKPKSRPVANPTVINPTVIKTAVPKPRQKNRSGAKLDPIPENGNYNRDVYIELNKWRKEVARDLELKLYMVLTNEVMRSLAAYRPKTEEELARIHGIGSEKINRYGETLLRLVKGNEPDDIEPAEKVETDGSHTRFLPRKK